MGYYSDVRIKLKKEDYDKLIEEFNKKFPDLSYNLFDCRNFLKDERVDSIYDNITDKFSEIKTVFFGWNGIKWYSNCYNKDYDDVTFIENYVKNCEHFAFTRIGEDFGDIEIFGNNLNYIYVKVEFDDDVE